MGGTTLRHANSPSMAGDRLLPGQRPALWLVPPLPDEPAPTVEDQTPTIAQRATVASAPLVDLPPLGSVERAGAVGPELGRVPRVASGPYDGRPRVARAPVRLTRRGRVVVLVLLTFLVAGIVITSASTGHAGAPAAPPASIVVHPGDTLWSIASRIHLHGSPTSTMLEIERLNHMPDGTVYVGQSLLVPRS